MPSRRTALVMMAIKTFSRVIFIGLSPSLASADHTRRNRELPVSCVQDGPAQSRKSKTHSNRRALGAVAPRSRCSRKKLAGIRRQDFRLCRAAMRAGDRRFQDHHHRITQTSSRARPEPRLATRVLSLQRSSADFRKRRMGIRRRDGAATAAERRRPQGTRRQCPRARARLPRSEAGIRSPIHGVTRTSPPRILPVNAFTIFAGPRLKSGSAKIWVRRNRRGRIHLDLDPARLVDVAVLRLRTALSSLTRCLKRIQPCGRYGSRPAHLLE
jgi:hypothetical protein